MPLLPYIIEYEIEEIIKEAKDNGAQYVLYKFLELKGDQKTIFMDILEKFNPNLIEKYEQLYYNSYQPKKEYITKINEIIEFNLIKNKISSVIEKN
jgi:DNA repair photolyase